MYRSVVVPLDGSAASEHVLPIAVQIARGSDATLRLVYVPNPDDVSTLEGGTSLDVALPARSSTRPQAYLEHIRQRLAAGSDLTITADVLHEPNAHANATRPDVTDMDLVVLATHRHNGLVRFRLGDITDALVYWRPAPILALRSASAAPDPGASAQIPAHADPARWLSAGGTDPGAGGRARERHGSRVYTAAPR